MLHVKLLNLSIHLTKYKLSVTSSLQIDVIKTLHSYALNWLVYLDLALRRNTFAIEIFVKRELHCPWFSRLRKKMRKREVTVHKHEREKDRKRQLNH